MTGDSITWLRTHLRMDVRCFAQLLGVHVGTVHRWESVASGSLSVDPLQRQLLTVVADLIDQRSPQGRVELGQELTRRILVGGTLHGLYHLLDLAFADKSRELEGSPSAPVYKDGEAHACAAKGRERPGFAQEQVPAEAPRPRSTHRAAGRRASSAPRNDVKPGAKATGGRRRAPKSSPAARKLAA